MQKIIRWNNLQRPGLLVSVRSAAEAEAALAGGADVIDVKEPDRGPLGDADRGAIEDIVRAVDGRATLTAAMGELIDVRAAMTEPVPAGVALFKLGLAGCRSRSNWRHEWQAAIQRFRRGHQHPQPQPVAVAYADWDSANAPPPHEVLAAARELHCPALLVDTWDKSHGTLFGHWPLEEVAAFVPQVRAAGLAVVLAGSLVGESYAAAAGLQPDLVAVRTAACEGGRRGSVSADRVQALKGALQSVGAAAAQEFS